jgi:anti-sigma regulatory factor (Ser/Thr protein kinase)
MNERQKEQVSMRFTLPVTHQYLNTVDACIVEMFARIANLPTEELGYQMQLAVHEICANIVDHAGASGEFEIAIDMNAGDHTFTVETSDNGHCEYMPNDLKLPDVDKLPTRGRGLWLVRQTMSEVMYHSHQGKTWRCDPQGHWNLESNAPMAVPLNRNIWKISKTW